MKIQMQYPINNKNKNFDGKIHEITPNKLIKINNSNLYILEYYDNSLGKNMNTILINTNNTFFKVPLNNYTFWNLIKAKYEANSEICPVEILPNMINCQNIISLGELKNLIKNNSNNYKIASKKLNIIYYNTFDSKYYYDINCTQLIKDKIELLGTLTDDKKMIIGKFTDYIIENVYVEKKAKKTIYFNDFDKKYYWDIECTDVIKDAPDILGTLDNNKNIIIGLNTNFYIENVYKVKLEKYILNTQEKKEINHYTKNFYKIFFNTFDNLYYYDLECNKKIEGAPESLGILSEDGKTITGSYADYSISIVYVEKKAKKTIYFNDFDKKYYWDSECTNEIKNAPKSFEINESDYQIETIFVITSESYHLNLDNIPSITLPSEKHNDTDICLYDEIKEVFYISENIATKINTERNLVEIDYQLPNQEKSRGKFIRICKSDIDNRNDMNFLLDNAKKVLNSRIVGKNGTVRISVFKDDNDNKYILLNNPDNNILKSFEIFIKNYLNENYIRAQAIPYNSKLRIELEKKYSQEIIFESRLSYIIKPKEKNIIIYNDSLNNYYITNLEAYQLFGNVSTNNYDGYSLLTKEQLIFIEKCFVTSYQALKNNSSINNNNNNYSDDDDDYSQYFIF